MKAFIIDQYGRKNGIRAGDMPMPEPREDDVLIQIHAAGVNPVDSKIRDGEFKLILPYRLPLILGNDLAGLLFASDRAHDDSNRAMRSMRDRRRITSALSRN